jgi:bifunctional DNA-binding transcriptional regulator/antitoxin component of YhaV-PrlF toxin-antitoxin module
MAPTKAKVTRNGQVSLPAELRRRWQASTVLVLDRGDYAIVRPIPHDPVAALLGAHAGAGVTAEQARTAEREAEAAQQSRRSAR